jgi:hypothetical protein
MEDLFEGAKPKSTYTFTLKFTEYKNGIGEFEFISENEIERDLLVTILENVLENIKEGCLDV